MSSFLREPRITHHSLQNLQYFPYLLCLLGDRQCVLQNLRETLLGLLHELLELSEMLLEGSLSTLTELQEFFLGEDP